MPKHYLDPTFTMCSRGNSTHSWRTSCTPLPQHKTPPQEPPHDVQNRHNQPPNTPQPPPHHHINQSTVKDHPPPPTTVPPTTLPHIHSPYTQYYHIPLKSPNYATHPAQNPTYQQPQQPIPDRNTKSSHQQPAQDTKFNHQPHPALPTQKESPAKH